MDPIFWEVGRLYLKLFLLRLRLRPLGWKINL